jgi:hypothetical protein
MSSVRYFVTEKDEAAKIGEMVQQRKNLKERLATLDHELYDVTSDLERLSKLTGTGYESERYVFDGDSLNVMRPSRYAKYDAAVEGQYELSRTIPLAALDKGRLIRLLTDLTETRNELERVLKQLQPFGIN